MDIPVLDTIAAKLKLIEAKALPGGLASTKFIAIAAAIAAGAFLLKGNVAAVLELLRWGVGLYVWVRLIEGCVHLVCDTALKIVTAKVAAHTVPVPSQIPTL